MKALILASLLTLGGATSAFAIGGAGGAGDNGCCHSNGTPYTSTDYNGPMPRPKGFTVGGSYGGNAASRPTVLTMQYNADGDLTGFAVRQQDGDITYHWRSQSGQWVSDTDRDPDGANRRNRREAARHHHGRRGANAEPGGNRNR